jgi:Cof subfamily protein (haloacid dehalogenase superfamily)
MRFRLVTLDLDGTLIGKEQVIPPRTRRAVQGAVNRGCLVTIATGRGFTPTARFAQDLGVNAPLICYQGALIRDPRDGTIIYTATIPLHVAQEVLTFSRARQLNVQVYTEDEQSYAGQVTPTIADIAEKSGVPVTGVGGLADRLDSPPFKFLVFVEQPEAIPELMRDLQAQFDGRLQVVQSWSHVVEATGLEVSKGEALARLAAHLGVSQSATMAVGDQGNDVSMIAWAGLGVAMGDASPAAKAAADVIAPPLAAEGAAWAIERHVLGE